MKLQAQYSKATIISSISVLLITGIGYYFLVHYILIRQLDEALRVEEVEIWDYVNRKQVLPEASTYKDQRISFEKAEGPVIRQFSSLMVYDAREEESELSRRLVFSIQLKGNYYTASVTKSQEETEKLIGLVLLITLAMILLLGIFLFFFNRFLLKRLWRPFYSLLSSMKAFNLHAPAPIILPATTIDEFRELGAGVNMMTTKVINDYTSLKNFADHASHEMQTPLAIINTKLDVLLQDPGLSESSHYQIQAIYNSVEKMARLSQSLLLLTKIENNQFHEKEIVNIRETVTHKLYELEEWIQAGAFEIKTDLQDLYVSMNRQLADILISNLVVNAIRHACKHKKITVLSTPQVFSISNPGSEVLDEKVIFDRFRKSAYSEGSGLGLAIAKQICDVYGFQLSYTYVMNEHWFEVEFTPSV